MALLSDREGFDRSVMRLVQYGMDSQMSKPTIIEVCQATGYSYPYSDDDLRNFVNFCDGYGIRTNVSHETFWKEYLTK